MRRRRLMGYLARAALAGGCGLPLPAQDTAEPDHVKWVAASLKRMLTIKPGMTRADLLKMFTTEGGLSTRTKRTYVSRDCPYFKADVEFDPVGQMLDEGGNEDFVAEEDADTIKTISVPYLQFSIMD